MKSWPNKRNRRLFLYKAALTFEFMRKPVAGVGDDKHDGEQVVVGELVAIDATALHVEEVRA